MQALLFAYILNGSLFAFSCLSKLIFIGILGSVLSAKSLLTPTSKNDHFAKSQLIEHLLQSR
jgi:hypothetical protein